MRVEVRKTYKLFVGGAFARSESGRCYRPAQQPVANVARASRKDLRDAVAAARKALPAWSGATAFLRGQILFRFAEVLETRKESLAAELCAGTDVAAAAALAEVEAAIDLATWYAGVPDKLPSLLGSQNAVSGPFFNFSTIEPTGVIGVVAPEQPALLGALALALPMLAGGNTVVLLVSEPRPLAGLALGELLAVSDVPAGTVDLLAGVRSELLPHLAGHRDVDGLLVAGAPDAEIGRLAADSVKRVRFAEPAAGEWGATAHRLSWIEPFVEVKSFWHPVAP